MRALERIRTPTDLDLNQMPLPLGYKGQDTAPAMPGNAGNAGNACPARDSNPGPGKARRTCRSGRCDHQVGRVRPFTSRAFRLRKVRIPAQLYGCTSAVAVCAPNVALLNLLDQQVATDVTSVLADSERLHSTNVVELEYNRVRLAAINAWVTEQVHPHKRSSLDLMAGLECQTLRIPLRRIAVVGSVARLGTYSTVRLKPIRPASVLPEFF